MHCLCFIVPLVKKNTVSCFCLYENATDCVEIKRGNMFLVVLYILRQTLCRLAPPCPFHLLFPSFSDVAEARSYFASTVRQVVCNILSPDYDPSCSCPRPASRRHCSPAVFLLPSYEKQWQFCEFHLTVSCVPSHVSCSLFTFLSVFMNVSIIRSPYLYKMEQGPPETDFHSAGQEIFRLL
jgi:hypothetical protein